MADQWYSPGYFAPEPPAARSGESLWTLTRGTDRVEAQLRDQGLLGCELIVLRGGGLFGTRRYLARRDAVARSEALKRDLLAKDWSLTAP